MSITSVREKKREIKKYKMDDINNDEKMVIGSITDKKNPVF